MIRFNKFNKAKSAGVSIEMILMIVLALGAIFLVLGIFNNNLRDMVAASGFNNLFNKTNATQYSTTAGNYTTSQVNVKIAGAQGLTITVPEYEAKAKAELAKLATTFAQNGSLTAQQQMDMAKWLTIYGIASPSRQYYSVGAVVGKYILNTPSLAAMAGQYGAYKVYVDGANHMTTLSGKAITWKAPSISPTAYNSTLESEQIKVINDLYNNTWFVAK